MACFLLEPEEGEEEKDGKDNDNSNDSDDIDDIDFNSLFSIDRYVDDSDGDFLDGERGEIE